MNTVLVEEKRSDLPKWQDFFSSEGARLLQSCIHCGLCLDACPTYRVNKNENDSPRGRLYLMKSLAEGKLDPVSVATEHLDLCLDCRACETACPSGVQYGAILESARESLLQANPPALPERILRTLLFKHIIPKPKVLRVFTKLLGFYQKSGLRNAARALGILKILPKRFQTMEAMQPELNEPPFLENAPEIFPADGGAPRKRVAFFSGCVMDQLMGGIHRATIKVLQAHGVEVLVIKNQVCCGALMTHSGEAAIARELARKNIQVFKNLGVDAIINNSAGCGAQLKTYHHLLPGDQEALEFTKLIKDVSEVLYGLEPIKPFRNSEKTICYDEPCHLLHAQRISAEPKAVLKRISGLKWVPLPEAEFCCGAAGIYNLTQPEMAGRILARKIEAIKSTGAEMVVTGNPGCLMQIKYGCQEAGLSCEVLHPMELLARQL